MTFIVVKPFYGPFVYHHPGCYTIRRRDDAQTVLFVPADAIACSHCGGAEMRKKLEPLRRQRGRAKLPHDSVDHLAEVTSFVLVRNHSGPSIAHHPTCGTLKSIRATGLRSNHRLVEEIPADAVKCSACKASPPRTLRKPVGSYYVEDRVMVPTCCPECGGGALDRLETMQGWFCYGCDWEGRVNSSTWRLMEKPKAVLPLRPSGTRAELRQSTKYRQFDL